MKYQSKLLKYQNVREWKKHRQKTPRSEYNSLSNDEKAWLQAFNKSLRELEEKYLAIFSAKYKELQARVVDPSDMG